MKNDDWINLFRLVPPEQHNSLVVTTRTGVDLNIDTILRTEETYFVFRGRVSGSTDDGRAFFVPYGQIDYVQLNRFTKETEIRRMFGEGGDSEEAAPSGLDEFPAATGEFQVVQPTGLSRTGAPVSPATPSTPAAASPSGPALPNVAARLSSSGITGRKSHPPAPAGDLLAPPRNNILERLRAQRNSVVGPKPRGGAHHK
jgi:hypothetical protein